MDPYEEEFDNIGEDQVRHNLTTGKYAGKRKKHALAWLERKARHQVAAEEERSLTSNAEQLSIARSAKDAAWAAADAARDANRNATRANVIAIGALIVATIGATPTIYAFIRSFWP
jgi:ferric-dicitrate binding protein FerR (iron transport regulator)